MDCLQRICGMSLRHRVPSVDILNRLTLLQKEARALWGEEVQLAMRVWALSFPRTKGGKTKRKTRHLMRVWALLFPIQTQASFCTTYADLNTLKQLTNSRKDNMCADQSSCLTFA